jgi:hypothetical protein
MKYVNRVEGKKLAGVLKGMEEFEKGIVVV